MSNNNSRYPKEFINFLPDERLLQRARAESQERLQLDSNNNLLNQSSSTIEISECAGPTCRRISSQSQNVSSSTSNLSLLELKNKFIDTKKEISRLNNQLNDSTETFTRERQTLLNRIEELEYVLENLKFENQREQNGQSLSNPETEIDQTSKNLSQELTKAFQQNSTLLEENTDLKSVQLTLLHRVNSLEEKLSHIDTTDYLNVQNLLTTLQKRELGLKNQRQRLAQLESYYIRELQQISHISSYPTLHQRENQQHTFIHPQSTGVSQPITSCQHPSGLVPCQYSLGVGVVPRQYHPGVIPNEYPPGVVVPCHHQPFTSPMQNEYPKSNSSDISNSPSYSELYYKSIIDKAKGMIQRKIEQPGDICLKKSTKSVVIPPITSMTQNIISNSEFGSYAHAQGTTASVLNGTNFHDEEQILRELFFKF